MAGATGAQGRGGDAEASSQGSALSEHAQPDAGALAAAVLETTLESVFVVDSDSVVVDLNPAAERTFGYIRPEAVGQELARLILPARLRRRHRDSLRVGDVRGFGAVASRRVELTGMRADGTELLVEMSVRPLPTGRSLAAVFLRDVTQPHRDAEARELLAAASAAFDASLDPLQTMRTIAQTAIPQLAGLCMIDLIREDGTIGDSVVAAMEADLAARLERLRADRPLDPEGMHPVARALRLDAPIVVHDLAGPDAEGEDARTDEHIALMVQAGYRSAVVIRLSARGRLLGALSFLHESDALFDQGHLALMQDLADRAAMALDNATLYAERTHVALTLQRSLLPDALPEVAGLELASAYHPVGAGNEVGGDFYDVFEVPSGCWLVVGDVCGKGTEAAAITALVRHSVRALAFRDLSPGEVLASVNEVMLSHELQGRFATAVVARLDLSVRPVRASIVSAGHPPPLVLERSGNAYCPQARGVLLGVLSEISEVELDVDLEPGDTLVLYTDGLLDAGAPNSPLTERELCERLSGHGGDPPGAVVAKLDLLARAHGAGRLRDDIAILAARVTP